MSAFQNALAAGQAAIRRAAGEAVTYHRGNDSVLVTAVAGATRVELDDEGGMAVTSEVRDWLIAAAEIVLSGEAVEPAAGDLIRRQAQGFGSLGIEVYEVCALGGEPCCRPSGTAGTTWRIHTRHVDTESP